ncbi:MAG: hypothetical protein DKM50_01605 [Candidatus Margulisiibacteriota bacterium]|nr:MAG: hypothetical protein DKM50_01605 [Candidatus Margulisiibacteriota bacterium]
MCFFKNINTPVSIKNHTEWSSILQNYSDMKSLKMHVDLKKYPDIKEKYIEVSKVYGKEAALLYFTMLLTWKSYNLAYEKGVALLDYFDKVKSEIDQYLTDEKINISLPYKYVSNISFNKKNFSIDQYYTESIYSCFARGLSAGLLGDFLGIPIRFLSIYNSQRKVEDDQHHFVLYLGQNDSVQDIYSKCKLLDINGIIKSLKNNESDGWDIVSEAPFDEILLQLCINDLIVQTEYRAEENGKVIDKLSQKSEEELECLLTQVEELQDYSSDWRLRVTEANIHGVFAKRYREKAEAYKQNANTIISKYTHQESYPEIIDDISTAYHQGKVNPQDLYSIIESLNQAYEFYDKRWQCLGFRVVLFEQVPDTENLRTQIEVAKVAMLKDGNFIDEIKSALQKLLDNSI